MEPLGPVEPLPVEDVALVLPPDIIDGAPSNGVRTLEAAADRLLGIMRPSVPPESGPVPGGPAGHLAAQQGLAEGGGDQ